MEYFNGLKVNINDVLKINQEYMAHSRNSLEGNLEFEKIEDHLELTLQYFEKICREKGLYKIFENLYNSIFSKDDYNEIFRKLIINTVYFHDFGKINAKFQIERLGNKNIKKDRLCKDNLHSKYSAWIFFTYFFNEIKKASKDNLEDVNNENTILINLLIICTSVIYAHHSSIKNKTEIFNLIECNVGSYNNFLKTFVSNELLNELSDDNKKSIKNVLHNELTLDIMENLYIFSRLLFGLLTQADVLSTIDYIKGIKINNFGLLHDFSEIENIYASNPLLKTIKDYSEGKYLYSALDLNKIRSDLFLETQKNLIEGGQENSIYQVEAPTGAGKTLISLNLTMKLLQNDKNLNKVFYAFPFNTLVEQTYNSICSIFNDNGKFKQQISIYNSINSFENIDLEDEILDYTKLFMEYQFLYTPFVISTNIKLFDILFGTKKSSYYPLALLANSVLIIDEVQAYKNILWPKIIRLLDKYSKLLNIKIIIMSATIPNLNQLLNNEGLESKVKALVKDPQIYYQNDMFKNRVKLDFSLLDKNYNTSIKEEYKSYVFEDIFNLILQEIKDKSFFLIEFIKKSSAREFRDYIKEKFNDIENISIFLITGTTNRRVRKQIIDELKEARKNDTLENNRKYIVISTQVIEAGVDIDMDIGFKDISILDSEEQFLGRINRNFKRRDAKAYFFNLDNTNNIYRNDARTEKDFTLASKNIRNILEQKQFTNYFTLVIDEMKRREDYIKGSTSPYFLNEAFLAYNHEDIEKYYTLIDKKEYKTVFLNAHLVEDENPMDIWNEYKNIINDFTMENSEKKIKLIKIRTKMDSYTYDVPKVDIYNEFVGGIYFIDDADRYFVDKEFYPELLVGDSSIEFM